MGMHIFHCSIFNRVSVRVLCPLFVPFERLKISMQNRHGDDAFQRLSKIDEQIILRSESEKYCAMPQSPRFDAIMTHEKFH